MKESTMHNSKTCNKCKQILSLENFGKHSYTSDGLRSWCKVCNIESSKKYRQNNQEKVRETKRNWVNKNKDKKAAWDKAYYEKNKEKISSYHKKWRKENADYVRETTKQYREANKEKKAAGDRRWAQANKDKVNENSRRYRQRHPEKQNEIHRNYNKRNPEVWRTIAQNRRTRKLENGIFLVTTKDIKRILNKPCAYCGSKDRLTLDHIIPISRGGRHSIGNLLSACKSCNSKKHNKFITEWEKYAK